MFFISKTRATTYHLTISLSLLLLLIANTIIDSKAELPPIRVALFLDKGAHPRSLLRDNLGKDPEFAVSVVDGESIRHGSLNNIDVLFMPGGSGKAEAFSLGEEGKAEVCRFVNRGGIYLGVCAGCYLASCARPQYLRLMPATTVDKEHWRRGKANLTIAFTKLGMEIFGYPQELANVVYHNGPVLQPLNNHNGEIIPLSYFRTEAVAKGGTPGLMINAPAMVLCRYGNGLVLGISPHPEATPGLTTIEMNAIHWLYNHRPTAFSGSNNKALNTVPRQGAVPAAVTVASTHNDLCTQVYNKAEEIFERTINSHYQHLHQGVTDQVEQINGNYQINTDCSGFVSYVINAIAPNHYAVIDQMSRRNYPRAAIFARFFLQLPPHTVTEDWLRISDFKDLKRGDIIAWERSNSADNINNKHIGSGHVMIVIQPQSQIMQTQSQGKTIKYLEVFVLDSSSVEHFPPQLLPPLARQTHRNGLGKGMIRLILDKQSNIIGFWEGTFSHERNAAINGPSYTKNIAFARLISLTN